MNIYMHSFVCVMLIGVISTVNATSHNQETSISPLIENDLNQYEQAIENLNMDNSDGYVFIESIDKDPVNNPYNSFAQSSNDGFVVLKKDIELVQQALIDLGYDVGNVDGIAHNKTITAIVELQTKEGLTVTGEIDPELLDFLKIKY